MEKCHDMISLIKALCSYWADSFSRLNFVLHLKKIMKQINTLLSASFLISFTITSCFSPRYQLNAKEKEYVGRSNRYDVIDICYDKKAIRQLKTNGIYTVKISETDGAGTLCSMDTMTIKAKAIKVANTVSPIMNFREHHQFVDVEFTSFVKNGNKNALGEDVSCSYTIRMPLNNLLVATVLKSTNTNDAYSLRRR
jgi:hypothetical protein